MADSKSKNPSDPEQLKVDAEAKSRVYDLVEITRKVTGKKPTHAEVLKMAMDALEQSFTASVTKSDSSGASTSDATVTKLPIKNESPAPATTLEVLLQIGELSQRVNQLATEARIHLEKPRVPQQTNVEEPVRREYNPVHAAALAPPGSAEERLHLEMAKLMGFTEGGARPAAERPDSGGRASERTAGPVAKHPAKTKRPA